MQPFVFERASTLEAALEAGSRGARYLAGATNLFDLMKLGVERPAHIVDISALPLRAIEPTHDGGFLIGALTTGTAMAGDERLRQVYPFIGQAILSGATQQIRNAATLGGNLLQRTRCPYFQDIQVQACNKRAGGTGCAARDGIDRSGAVLAAPPDCIATMPSDMAVALVAAGAEIELMTRIGKRTLALSDLYAPALLSGTRDAAIQPGELLTGVRLPPCPEAGNSTYAKVRERASYAFALVSVAAAMACDEAGRVTALRIGLGNVAPVPWRKLEAEGIAIGKVACSETFAQVAEVLLQPTTIGRCNGFKLGVARRLVIRILTFLSERFPHHGSRAVDSAV